MSLLLRDGSFIADDWRLLADGEALPPDAANLIVSLSRWRAEGDALRAHAAVGGKAVGVRIPNTENIDALWPQLAFAPLIALEWPQAGDGRALSQARALRQRYGYAGALRAVGCVQQDYLQQMLRCGVDVFDLATGQNSEACAAALHSFALAYQPAADALPQVWALRRALV